ncbi:2-oxoacid ferredoxin oxidoreductase alpha subunit [Pyrobaculum aerophilum str. IM2]|uniref:2-oxoacid oxidoreductase (ferredoxin) n=2 Tax=Pyrobaculum aerophilum TaxID=13773 RepID=Q8ZWY6_PYRAE|nr:2-oxoacid:acceptor oxidoreductase subunit alpha [Pyrobaculum aerophilum]AAL63563.1 2-oxoacid ferredoxin oxidoreductase alpha subunit [Pyrobaculum aerophilum str. IM2]HII46430.1 2-oxoacid:acceptor oxidoreductase subunit alpha [Pyrobaculum aerophilum]
MDLTIRISGAQGEGVETTGRTLASVFARMGYHVFGYRQYGSIIKGNPTMFYQIRVSDRKIYSHGQWRRVDVLIALNETALAAYRGMARYIISEKEVPLSEIATKHGNRIMRNVASLGALAALLGLNPKHIADQIRKEFGERGEKIAEANIAVLEDAYNFASSKFAPVAEVERLGDPRVLMSGAEALALGSVMSGMKFYAAYPMTPASPILHWLAEWGPKFGVAVVQPEDEIAAINMAIGASYAGVRAATGTSGGGFDLMHEAFGLAAMLETPVVVFLAQRGGPSTGLPTETEQSDLLMALSPSHGEYPHAVIAPRWIEEGLYAPAKAFNIAEKYQVPVIVLIDLYFTESLATVEFDPHRFKIERGELLQSPLVWEEYKRYKITESGVSPRTIPGVPGGMHIATSDEHDERGDVITDRHLPEVRRAMHDKRMRKLAKIAEEMEPPLIKSDGDIYAVGWGSTSMPLLDYSAERGIGLALFRDLYPMRLDSWAERLNSAKEVVVVEVNYRGQFADYLSSKGVKVTRRVLKWWGEPFSVDELREWI